MKNENVVNHVTLMSAANSALITGSVWSKKVFGIVANMNGQIKA